MNYEPWGDERDWEETCEQLVRRIDEFCDKLLMNERLSETLGRDIEMYRWPLSVFERRQ